MKKLMSTLWKAAPYLLVGMTLVFLLCEIECWATFVYLLLVTIAIVCTWISYIMFQRRVIGTLIRLEKETRELLDETIEELNRWVRKGKMGVDRLSDEEEGG